MNSGPGSSGRDEARDNPRDLERAAGRGSNRLFWAVHGERSEARQDICAGKCEYALRTKISVVKLKTFKLRR